jgi:hypothetical protein
MATKFPVENLLLQGDANADGYTILNLNLSGLNLTKASVGLDQVDNTADLDKPLSGDMITALALKEGNIEFPASNAVGKFWRGDKTWVDYGSLALQNGVTTLPLISVIGANASSSAVLAAKRSDHQTSLVQTSVQQLGASVPGIMVISDRFSFEESLS